MQSSIKAFGLSVGFIVLAQSGVNAANILYLNSITPENTGNRGSFRSSIAQALDDYGNGNTFNVNFIQTHSSGDLAFLLGEKPIDFYDQIWFDTGSLRQSILNSADLDALNNWAANDQPEFILDSSLIARNDASATMSASAIALTVNQALALDRVGGGILLGAGRHIFTGTVNQILDNFGFDHFFYGDIRPTNNAAFVGDLLLGPETVTSDFFDTNLEGLSSSHVPIGQHILNENGGNRTVQVYENLYSLEPSRVSRIGTTFNTDDNITNPSDTTDVPTPLAGLQALIMAASGWFRKQKQKQAID